MPIWAKFQIVGHNCPLPFVGPPMDRRRIFYASSIQTVKSFQSYWGGTIKLILMKG